VVRGIEFSKILWVVAAIASISMGLHFLLTEPLIFEPGGWFALDGRRVLEATDLWRHGGDPYSLSGFLYSPLALTLAAPLLQVPRPVVVLGWMAATIVLSAFTVWRATDSWQLKGRLLAIAAVLLFIPVVADVVLANVTTMIVVAMYMAINGRSMRSAFALGLLGAAFPKPLLGPVFVWLLVFRPRQAAGALLSSMVTVAGAIALSGSGIWRSFFESLARGGGISLAFVGNYGLTAFSLPAAMVAAVATAIIAGILVFRMEAAPSLAAVTAAGIFLTPYTGIYAAVPILVSLRGLSELLPITTPILAILGVITAPWSPIIATCALLAAVRGSLRTKQINLCEPLP
jgi:hypothetical protein